LNFLRTESLADFPPQAFSLLGLSALSRLSFAAVAIAGIWGAVLWALS
jgi:hypothetical protein